MGEISLKARIPDHEHVIALEPEELGSTILEELRRAGKSKYSYEGIVWSALEEYDEVAGATRYRLGQAIAEAWNWLEREGILVDQRQLELPPGDN